MDNKDNLCGEHENQHLSLFCYPCEMNICVKCWFSEEHAEHKERAVPLEEAFEHYMQNMTATLTWINGRKEVVDHVLKQVQENLSRLSQEKELIEKLRGESEELITGKANPACVMQIITTERAMAELRLNHQDETESVRLDRRREFMSEATVLDFRMTEFDSTIKNHGSCKTNLQAPYGFEWKCEITNEDDGMYFYLSLMAGKPSDYSVLFDGKPEKVCRFELDSAVKIGVYKPVMANVVNDSQKLTVQIRQSYGDRFQQLHDYITRLEKENAEHLAFKTYLADWDKRLGPSSG
ncbi:E3 ubiquitin-protein ligase TRIM17-like [Ochlerotatus camptorhynchus]|uniref:E3 ubiquitin-protein ligase TRIM17-like n=1 Tax=Ochlerotatus camptorhynchus TaxID=644619 RepID=UPI0031D98232